MRGGSLAVGLSFGLLACSGRTDVVDARDAGAPDTGMAHLPADASADVPLRDAGGSEAGDATSCAEPDPIWVPVPEVVSCSLVRLANPESFHAWSWRACDGIAGCEQAEIDGCLFGAEPPLWAVGVVDDGSRTVVAVESASPSWSRTSLIVDESGQVLVAYRAEDYCAAEGPWLGLHRFAMKFTPFTNDPTSYGVLDSLDAPDPQPFALPESFYPPERGLGDVRWIWGDEPNSVSAFDASDPVQFAEAASQFWGQYVSIGDRFLVAHGPGPATGAWQVVIDETDGLTTPTPFITPDGDRSDWSPVFAESHIGWLRDGPTGGVEVWSSPFTTDPAKLVPQKLGDSIVKRDTSRLAQGAWGNLAIVVRPAGSTDAYDDHNDTLEIWNLATGAVDRRAFPLFIEYLLGVSSKYVWLEATPGTDLDGTVYRISIE